MILKEKWLITKTAAETYIKKLELNVGGGEDEDVLIGESDERYPALKKTTEESIKKARRMAKRNAKYKEIKRALDAMQCENNEEEQNEDNEEEAADLDERKNKE